MLLVIFCNCLYRTVTADYTDFACISVHLIVFSKILLCGLLLTHQVSLTSKGNLPCLLSSAPSASIYSYSYRLHIRLSVIKAFKINLLYSDRVFVIKIMLTIHYLTLADMIFLPGGYKIKIKNKNTS